MLCFNYKMIKIRDFAKWIVFLAALIAALPLTAQAMTIEQAYSMLSHQRPVFSPVIGLMPENESAYLTQLFGIIDQAVVQRVGTMTWLAGKGESPEPFDDYDAILFQLSVLRPPKKLLTVHQLTVQAIEEQRDLIRQWKKEPRVFVWENARNHPLIVSSSQKLHHAYNHVMELYPQEHQKNREAFYDYFCCLDFL